MKPAEIVLKSKEGGIKGSESRDVFYQDTVYVHMEIS
jgi:hypothetical protein